MFVTAYLLILAWQKDYGHAATAPQQQAAAVTSHEVSADLPNAQNATAASDMPQANVRITNHRSKSICESAAYFSTN
jgi:YidC/Oxa1 family membrane protein insertase